jgi:carbon storage regulator
MLVLTRKRDDFIKIGSDIVIRVMKTGKGSVKIGIEAPASIRVMRGELATMENEAVADCVDLGEFEECTLDALLVQH